MLPQRISPQRTELLRGCLILKRMGAGRGLAPVRRCPGRLETPGPTIDRAWGGVLSVSAIKERIPDLICQEILAFRGWSFLIQPRLI